MKNFDIAAFNKNEIANEYKFATEDSMIVTQREWQDEFEDTRKPKDSYIELYTSFYKNGKIKLFLKKFLNNFIAGVMKEYDEQGNLIKETDYDAPYKFTWEDILYFIKKRKLDMNAYGFGITRSFGFGKQEETTKDPFWAITYNKGEEDMLLGVIILDGITGKIIKEYEEDYPIEE